MIAVDSSALITVLEQESEAEHFLAAIRDAPRCLVSALSVYETGIVVGVRRGWESAAQLMVFLDELGIEIVPFTEPYISEAFRAYARFGKGIDPKARLNLGDCAPMRSRRCWEFRFSSRGTISRTRISRHSVERAEGHPWP